MPFIQPTTISYIPTVPEDMHGHPITQTQQPTAPEIWSLVTLLVFIVVFRFAIKSIFKYAVLIYWEASK